MLGGKKQKLVAFVARVRSMPVPAATAGRGSQDDWSGIVGAADGMTVMDESDAVLMPRWRRPNDSKDGARHKLVAMGALLAVPGQPPRFGTALEALRLEYLQPVLQRLLLDRGTGRDTAPAPGLIGLRINGSDLVFTVDKIFQGRDGESRRPHKYHTYAHLKAPLIFYHTLRTY